GWAFGTAKVSMNENCCRTTGAKAGGVGRHWPIAIPPVNGGYVVVNPSVARQARISLATAAPQASPRLTDCPLESSSSSSESKASEAALSASKVACCAGKRLERVV